MKQALAIAAMLLGWTVGATPSHGDGDAKKGAELFKVRCHACHTVDDGGTDKVGPNLFGVFGATAGKRAFSFELRHSAAMKESGIVWSDETLDGFLENPGKYLPGTRMPFVGFRNQSDRDDVIAYLKSVTQ